ncbi:YsnF/AvaK domain-containing protein [Arthrobacter sp. N1]|uniref:YsnF/AvaK domain-containing protein n=1 Tax=Arthrobacter sp. N1 TaxID=619291 RepID=UPI003BAFAD56
MLSMTDLDPLIRRRSAVQSGDGDRLGPIGVVYLDDADETPTWVTVHTGLFGTRESFVPLQGASVQGQKLVVAYPRDLIRHAPSIDRDGHLGPEEEAELYRHYGLDRVAPPATSSAPATPVAVTLQPEGPAVPGDGGMRMPDDGGTRPLDDGRTRALGAAGTGPEDAVGTRRPDEGAPQTHDDGRTRALGAAGTGPEDAVGTRRPDGGAAQTHDEGGTPWVVRSEERLRVGTERVDAARVRLRKYVVTEEAMVSVSLKREELRIEVEPVTSASNLDGDDAPFQEQSVELVAREEVAVVGKETVALERVRMRTVEGDGRATVREEVRKERIASTVAGTVSGTVSGSVEGSAGGVDAADVDDAPTSRGRTSSTRDRTSSARDRTRTGSGSPSTTGSRANPLMKGGKRRR